MANVLEIEITYPNGAVRSERWELSELFCPNCGKRGCVWCEDDPGDYYVGPDYLCMACSTVFEMPSMTVAGLIDRAKISALMAPVNNDEWQRAYTSGENCGGTMFYWIGSYDPAPVDQDELILSDRKESDVKANAVR